MLIYIAIIGFICIFFISKFISKESKEPFKQQPRGLLILYGESFRTGGMGSRERDCDECFDTQQEASESHVDFIEYVKNKHHIEMDVLIDTYDTKYESELKGFYDSPKFYSHKRLLGGDRICQHALEKIEKHKYDFILLTRPDIFIKNDFKTIFNPFWRKIYFLSPVEQHSYTCGFSKNENGQYYPQINPTFIFIPSEYFHTLSYVNTGHHAWNHYIENFKLTEDDMGFMVGYQFDTNSAKLNNPYYKMVGRVESDEYMDKSITIQYPLIQKSIPEC